MVRPRQLVGTCVLVVDDQAEVLLVVQAMLQRSGAEVVTAHGGREALEALDRWGTDLDVVLTDLNMPDVDGWAVASHAKAEQPDRPVIAFTGLATDLSAEQLAQGRVDAVLAKPCRASMLESTIREHLDHTVTPDPAT